MTSSRIDRSTRVRVEFDLRQSIDSRGYQQPNQVTFDVMQRAFENWLWYEIEEHWHEIVEGTGFDFADAVAEGGSS